MKHKFLLLLLVLISVIILSNSVFSTTGDFKLLSTDECMITQLQGDKCARVANYFGYDGYWGYHISTAKWSDFSSYGITGSVTSCIIQYEQYGSTGTGDWSIYNVTANWSDTDSTSLSWSGPFIDLLGTRTETWSSMTVFNITLSNSICQMWIDNPELNFGIQWNSTDMTGTYAGSRTYRYNTGLSGPFLYITTAPGNTAPVLSVIINSTPDNLNLSSSTLNMYNVSSDAEGDYLFVTEYIWYNSSDSLTYDIVGVNSSSLSSTYTSVGQYFIAQMSMSDGEFTTTSNSTSLLILNSVPSIVINSPDDDDHDNINLTVDYTPSDADSDILNCYLFINDTLNVTDVSITLDISNTMTSDLGPDGVFSWYVNCSDTIDSVVSTPRIYTLDTINPIITVTSPLNNSWHNTNFQITATAEDSNIYIFNYSFRNSTEVLQSNNISTLTGISLSFDDIVDISSLNLTEGTQYYIDFFASDRHTGQLNGLLYSYFNGTLTFYDESDVNEKIDIDIGYYQSGTVYKMSPEDITNYNVVEIIDEQLDRYEFGVNFTLPNTNFVFGFRFDKPSEIVLVDETSSHFILFDKYWIDYILYLVINGVEYEQTSVLEDKGSFYQVYWNVNWVSYNLNSGDNITVITKSIGSLNTAEKTYYVNIGDPSAPILSNINSTTYPVTGDISEPYDTYANYTPVFSLNTDINSDGYISDDNSTWNVCSGSGTQSHVCIIPPEQKLGYGNDTVYVKFSNSLSLNSTYDIWDVFTGYYIQGNVTDTNGNFISNTFVQAILNEANTPIYSTYSNSTGNWIIGVPISGQTYTIIGYKPTDTTLGGAIKPFVEVN